MRRVERLRAEVHRAVAQHLEPGEPPIGIALVMEGPAPPDLSGTVRPSRSP